MLPTFLIYTPMYYKIDSIPLEEASPGLGERLYDIYGNYVEIDAFGKPTLLKRSVLKENIKINSFESTCGLETFWRMSRKLRERNEIQNRNKE